MGLFLQLLYLLMFSHLFCNFSFWICVLWSFICENSLMPGLIYIYIYIYIFFFFFFFLIFLDSPCGKWDRSSLTRDWTRTPCVGSSESSPLDRQGSPQDWYYIFPESICTCFLHALEGHCWHRTTVILIWGSEFSDSEDIRILESGLNEGFVSKHFLGRIFIIFLPLRAKIRQTRLPSSSLCEAGFFLVFPGKVLLLGILALCRSLCFNLSIHEYWLCLLTTMVPIKNKVQRH